MGLHVYMLLEWLDILHLYESKDEDCCHVNKNIDDDARKILTCQPRIETAYWCHFYWPLDRRYISQVRQWLQDLWFVRQRIWQKHCMRFFFSKVLSWLQILWPFNIPLILKVLSPVVFGNDDRFIFWLENDRTLRNSLVCIDFLQLTSRCSQIICRQQARNIESHRY